ncbi:MAG TPA: hypothetical protein VKK81_17695 [Candidatus Binatia bacterium]|nr:hypothetical protein [Candidatus Binatia bacterium]
MIMTSVDLYWIGKRFGVNSNTKAVGEQYMNITTLPAAVGYTTHHGGLHCVGPVALLTPQRLWLRASLDRLV